MSVLNPVKDKAGFIPLLFCLFHSEINQVISVSGKLNRRGQREKSIATLRVLRDLSDVLFW